ncbi:DNA cytosine methyltransferase [Vibrio harveyi]
MNKFAYYNEIDPFAAQWLKNLINAGVIAPGVVDERSIADVKPAEIKEFTQCHFFAGIGVWSYALRASGWDDHRPVWTGSCPCQPFSTAGKGKGITDERHLWPHWFHLIQICQPDAIFGEQVASKDGLSWLDTVQADLEASGYTNASVDLCAAGVGAPHIRQRAWFFAMRKLAYASSSRRQWLWESAKVQRGLQARSNEFGQLPYRSQRFGISDIEQTPLQGIEQKLAHSTCFGCERKRRERETGATEHSEIESLADSNNHRQQPSQGRRSSEGFTKERDNAGRCCSSFSLTNTQRQQLERSLYRSTEATGEKGSWETAESTGYGAVNGFWRDADWIYCRDEKYRPIEPGTIPLVDGVTANMVRESTDPETARKHPKIRKGALRGYGNAINSEVARAFIETVMEYIP